MCRGKTDGGRRCPCSNPERRSAYRKANGALGNAKTIGEGGKLFDLSSSPDKSLTEEWQPDRMKDLMDDFSYVLSSSRRGLPNKEGVDSKSKLDEYMDLQRKLNKMGTNEELVRTFGEAVAREAERRAGVTAEQIYAEQTAYIEEAEKKEVELKSKLADAKAIYESTPEYVKYKADYDEWNVIVSDPFNKIEDRRAARDKFRDSRDAAEKTEAYKEKLRADSELGDVRQILVRNLGPNTQEQLNKLSDAYVETLSEVRELGGEIKVTADTNKASKNALTQVSHHFPSDWIEYSNKTPLKARISKARAHYASNKRFDKKVRRQSQAIRLGYLGDDPEVDSDNFTFEPITDDKWETFKDQGYDRDNSYIRYSWETATYDGGDVDESMKPKGSGWKMHTSVRTGRKIWRRPMMENHVVSSGYISELTTNIDYTLVKRGDDFASTSAHEFTHRCEHMNGDIGRMEMAFLQRRTQTEEGDREDAVAMYGGRKRHGRQEMTRSDGFADVYMGKDYGSSMFHEVMSTGVEAVFYGEFGGLVGAGKYKPDTDMRAFVLGVLASVGRKTHRDA